MVFPAAALLTGIVPCVLHICNQIYLDEYMFWGKYITCVSSKNRY
jgi:hypothetical protein